MEADLFLHVFKHSLQDFRIDLGGDLLHQEFFCCLPTFQHHLVGRFLTRRTSWRVAVQSAGAGYCRHQSHPDKGQVRFAYLRPATCAGGHLSWMEGSARREPWIARARAISFGGLCPSIATGRLVQRWAPSAGWRAWHPVDVAAAYIDQNSRTGACFISATRGHESRAATLRASIFPTLPAMSDANPQTQRLLTYSAGSALHLL